MPDAEVIVESVRVPEEFAVLYRRHVDAMYRYAYRRVGPDHAQDVVSEAFLAAFRRRVHYDASVPDARAWLFGVLTKEISRHRRKEESRYRTLARIQHDPSGPSLADQVVGDMAARAAGGALASALARLSSGDRDVLLLAAWAGLSYEEIANAVGIPVGTVRSRLNRARRKIREQFGGVNPTSEVEE